MTDTKLIPLTKGRFALVDAADYEWLMGWKWYFNGKYAARKQHISFFQGKQKQKGIKMHRVIMNTMEGMDTDHINGDGLDNRRENLRICTTSQNMANQIKTRGVSKYKGVVWDRARTKWAARVKINKKAIFLGRFDNEEEAGLAYNVAAQKYFGEFARINQI